MLSLWSIVVAYVVFAVVHIAYKLTLLTLRKLDRLNKCKTPGFLVNDKTWSRFFFGIAEEMKNNNMRLHDWRLGVMNDYGGLDGTTQLVTPITLDNTIYLTGDPAVIKHILKDRFDIWTKPPPKKAVFWALLTKFLGRGIFTLSHGKHAKAKAEGDLSADEDASWYHQRKTAAAIFSRNNFRTLMHEAFLEKANTFISILDQECVSQSGTKPAVPPRVDMQSKFFAFTMDSIMQIFYGRDTHNLRNTEDPYASAFDTAHRSMLTYLAVNLPKLILIQLLPYPFGPLQPATQGGFLEPMFRKFNSSGSVFEQNVKLLRQISIGIVNDRKHGTDFATECPDLLSLFLSSEKQKSIEKTDSPLKQDNESMCDVVLNFVIAGRDTTACCLSWTFFELARNPEVQEKLYQEILNGLGEDTEPNYDNLDHSKLPYLHAVVYESLRLHPPVPFNMKHCTEDDVLPGGIECPKGTWVFYYPWVMARDPKRYPNPMDFKPERWIPFTQPNPYEFPVFQAGPRICLGRDMALFEAKLVTAMLIRKFKFRMTAGDISSITYDRSLTMSICCDKNIESDPQARPAQLWMTPERR